MRIPLNKDNPDKLAGPDLSRLIILLLITTTLLVLLRLFFLSSDVASGDRFWELNIDASFEAIENKSLINIGVPATTLYSHVVHQASTSAWPEHFSLKRGFKNAADRTG